MGTKINLDYQIDQTQLDESIETHLQTGASSLEVVNISGDTMTGELKAPNVNFNIAGAGGLGVHIDDTGKIYGSYSGSDSILHITYGEDAADKLQLEYYNGSTTSNIMVLNGNKDVDFADRHHTITATGNVVFDVTGDMLLDVDTSLTLNSPAISLVQGNNKIQVNSSMWQLTNDDTIWEDIATAGIASPIGSIIGIHPYAPAPDSNHWVYCNGSGTLGANFPGYEGTSIPTLTDSRFLMGSTAYGEGGANSRTIVEANLPGHTHAIDHNHDSVTSGAVSSWHTHTFTTGNVSQGHTHSYNDYSAHASRASGQKITADDVPVTGRQTGGISANHTHSGTTANPNNNHTHSVDLPNFTGSSGSTGSDTALTTTPLYFKVKYYIRTV